MPTPDEVIAATRAWLEKAVIGLNLCPFAKAVYIADQVRFVVSEAETPEALLADLQRLLGVAEAAIVDRTPSGGSGRQLPSSIPVGRVTGLTTP